MKRHHAAVLSLGALLAHAGTADATENGRIAYPIGVNTVMVGATPSPGETWWQNYASYYTANSFNDSRGSSFVPGFETDVAVNAFRFIHTWNVDLGPFQLSSAVVVPLLNVDISTDYGSQSNFGIGDIAIEPLYLNFSNADHSFFGYAGLTGFLPTGGAVSVNYYSLIPIAYATWFPIRQLEISGTMGLEFHGENTQTGYQSGSLFFMEYGVDYYAFEKIPNLSVGFGGYVVKQFTDDELNGIVYRDGFRQEGFAIGPQLVYGTRAGAFALKWQHEFAAENRPEGDRFWFQFMLPLKFGERIK